MRPMEPRPSGGALGRDETPRPDGELSEPNGARSGPVMIRVYDSGQKGATAFFRNRPFLSAFLAELVARCGRRPRVLFHACSVGSEPYSFALWCRHHASGAASLTPTITATDVNPTFLAAA